MPHFWRQDTAWHRSRLLVGERTFGHIHKNPAVAISPRVVCRVNIFDYSHAQEWRGGQANVSIRDEQRGLRRRTVRLIPSSPTGQKYTVPSHSAAALQRVQSDDTSSGQRFAVATIFTTKHLDAEPPRGRGKRNIGHVGKECDREQRDSFPRKYLRETSFARMTRMATEAKTEGTRRWIAERSSGRRQCKPPKGSAIHRADSDGPGSGQRFAVASSSATDRTAEATRWVLFRRREQRNRRRMGQERGGA